MRERQNLRIHTLVFAAIQFEVSLSSSHFLIHFLSHCKHVKIEEGNGFMY